MTAIPSNEPPSGQLFDWYVCTVPAERVVPAGHVGLLPPMDECNHPECAAAYEGVDVVVLDVGGGETGNPGGSDSGNRGS